MRLLVTGGSGFIGRHLIRRLRARDGSAEILHPGREVDLTDRQQVMEYFAAIGPVDHILHLADVGGNARWAADHAIEQFLANNRMVTNVVEGWTTHQRSARLVGMSSLWAYPERVLLAREDDYWDGPLHGPTQTYGLVKKLLGAAIGAAKRQWGLRGTMLVLGNVYGPDDPSDRVIPSLIRRMRENPHELEIVGDGSETRDFIYIDDQIDGILAHLTYDGDLLNIGSGTPYAIRDVVEQLVALLPYHGRVRYEESRHAGVKLRQIDVARASEVTGWPKAFPMHSLQDGLRLTLASR